MSRRIFACFTLIVAFFSLAARRRSADPVFSQITAIVQSLSDVSGLSEKHPVPYGRMNKRQLRQFLTRRIKKTLRPEEIRADELALKLFGLVPQEFDLKKSTVDLLTEQAAAFYDYDEKKLFLLDDSSFTSETTTLAHELSHALADQHFDLAKFMEQTSSNDDENLAHTAVVEGQATWLMMAYELKQSGQPPVPTPEMVKSVIDSSEQSMADYPVLKGSPLYIQESLLFPYTEGTTFFDAVYKKMGKAAFSAVFAEAPSDSSQVMHPDRYFKHEKAALPKLPKLSIKNEGKEITEGSVGEFDHEILMRQYAGQAKASAIAPHLRGGQFKIVDGGKDSQPMLEYISQWDSEEQAGKFLETYKLVLRGKLKHCEFSSALAGVLAGHSESGYFVTKVLADTVWSVEGLSDIEEWNRLRAPQSTTANKVDRRVFRKLATGVTELKNLLSKTTVLALIATAAFAGDGKTNRKAPELAFTVPGQGQKLLSQYRGKVVALEFVMTTCPHCQAASRVMTKLQEEYASRGLQVLDIAINGLDDGRTPDQANQVVGAFARTYQVGFPVGWIAQDQMMAFMGFSMTQRMVVPQLVLIDRKGMIRYQTPPQGDENSLKEETIRQRVEDLLSMGNSSTKGSAGHVSVARQSTGLR